MSVVQMRNGRKAILSFRKCSFFDETVFWQFWFSDSSKISITSKQTPAASVDLATYTINTCMVRDSRHVFHRVSKKFGGLCTTSLTEILSLTSLTEKAVPTVRRQCLPVQSNEKAIFLTNWDVFITYPLKIFTQFFLYGGNVDHRTASHGFFWS